MNTSTDTIVAPATASGGAIAVIRLSGPEAIACCDRIFRGRKPLAEAAGHTLHYGEVIDGDRTIDDVVAAIYRAPHSYTGEDAVELSCHGSPYIVSEIIALLLRSGARMAQPGEFTIRAFLAGRMDLAQAEAVADLIASDSRASHAMASTQMRGGYSAALGALRDELLQLASLLELELDFSEEDVQFADRARLREMMHRIESEITRLTDSFRLGNAIKKGVAVAIVGEPNVGKSTLFNAITKAGAEAANYPFCTIEPNVGVVDVPDKRLSVLGEMVKAKKIVPAAMRFVDIAGLVKGASKGEGLGNKFLAHIREVDAVAQVVRCFEDGNITHVEGSIDPLRDIEIINTELCLADMESVEKRQERLVKLLKTGDKKVPIEKAVLDKVLAGLSEAVPARRLGLTEDELEFLKELHLLTMKPVLYVANVSEEEVADASANPHVQAVAKYAAGEGAEVIIVSAKMESEIAELPDEEAQEFLAMAGLEEAGLDRLIKAGFKLLGLMTYITAGEIEVRAWTIVRGTKAPQAAGKIHTDFERGFIRAEIVSYNDLVECGSKAAARDKGLVRLEGKEYVMQDGDVVEFRFNV